jgi:hypothetical protein
MPKIPSFTSKVNILIYNNSKTSDQNINSDVVVVVKLSS